MFVDLFTEHCYDVYICYMFHNLCYVYIIKQSFSWSFSVFLIFKPPFFNKNSHKKKIFAKENICLDKKYPIGEIKELP